MGSESKITTALSNRQSSHHRCHRRFHFKKVLGLKQKTAISSSARWVSQISIVKCLLLYFDYLFLTFFCCSHASLPECTKQLNSLKQAPAENLEVAVNPSDVVMRGTVYQQANGETEQRLCPSESSQPPTTQALRER